MDDATVRFLLTRVRACAAGPALAHAVEQLTAPRGEAPASGDPDRTPTSGPAAAELTVPELTASELAALVVATQRLAAWAQAQEARAAAALLAEQGGILAVDQAATIIKDWLRVTAVEGSRIVVRADRCTRFPQVLRALEAGRIDARKADTLLGAGAELTDDERAAALEKLLPEAPRRTWRWLSQQLNALNVRLHGSEEELRQAAAGSNVWLETAAPGMALLTALMPAKDAARVFNTVQAGADRIARRPGQTRRRGQCRADALTSLVTGRMIPDPIQEDPAAPAVPAAPATGPDGALAVPVTGPGQLVPPEQATDLVPVPAEDDGILSTAPTPVAARTGSTTTGSRATEGVVITAVEVPATVNVTVSAAVLADPRNDTPGVLEGLGPIPADVAREIAAEGVWRRLVTDPVTGVLTDWSTTTYRPPARLRAAVVARDGTCRHEGCDQPAAGCDLDHIQPFDHGRRALEPGRPGQTRAGNLHALCRRHHNLKTLAGWTVRRDPATGSETWTAPTGHTQTYRPDPLDPAARYATLLDLTGPTDSRPTEPRPAELRPRPAGPLLCPVRPATGPPPGP